MTTTKTRSPGITKRQTASGDRYDVVYRAPGSTRQRRKTFKTFADAKTFKATTDADIARGTWIDASDPTTVEQFARAWLIRTPAPQVDRRPTEVAARQPPRQRAPRAAPPRRRPRH